MSIGVMRRRARTMQPLSQVLETAPMARISRARFSAVNHVFAAVVGAHAAANSVIFGVSKNCLFVGVRSPELIKELLLQQRYLLRTLAERCPHRQITDVRYIHRPNLKVSQSFQMPLQRVRKKNRLDDHAAQVVRETAAQLNDDQLRESFEEWMGLALSSGGQG